jgi:hypothetical protein
MDAGEKEIFGDLISYMRIADKSGTRRGHGSIERGKHLFIKGEGLAGAVGLEPAPS